MPRSAIRTFDPPPSIVTLTAAACASFDGLHDLVGVLRFEEDVGGPAHLECRQRRERRVTLHAIDAECLFERRDQLVHETSFRSAYRSSWRSRAISAVTAS